jgi:hypothetical protein
MRPVIRLFRNRQAPARPLAGFLLAWLVTCPVMLPAHPPGDSAAATVPSPSFYRLDTLITLKLSLNSEDERLAETGPDFLYDLRPNVSYIARLHVNYRFISFRVGYIPRIFPQNRDNDIQGKTKLFTLETGLYTRHWNEELQFINLRGFYLYNTPDVVPGWQEGDPYIQFPDFHFRALRSVTTYKFNPRLSYKAIKNQTEVQTRTEGSVLAVLSCSYFLTDNRGSDPSQTSSQRTDNYDAVLSAGYTATFVAGDHFYVNAEAMAGYGVVYYRLTTRLPEETVHTYQTDLEYRFRESLRLGYHSGRFFCGGEAVFTQTTITQEESHLQFNNNRYTLQVFAGYHITAPKFMKKLPIP